MRFRRAHQWLLILQPDGWFMQYLMHLSLLRSDFWFVGPCRLWYTAMRTAGHLQPDIISSVHFDAFHDRYRVCLHFSSHTDLQAFADANSTASVRGRHYGRPEIFFGTQPWFGVPTGPAPRADPEDAVGQQVAVLGRPATDQALMDALTAHGTWLAQVPAGTAVAPRGIQMALVSLLQFMPEEQALDLVRSYFGHDA